MKGKKMIELAIRGNIPENPSPSGDKYFENIENLKEIKEAMEDVKNNRVRPFDMEALEKAINA